MIRVAAGQAVLDVEHPDVAWASALAAAREAASRGARLVVLPELASSGYVFRSRDEACDLSTSVHGTHVADLAALSAELDLVLVCGWAEAADGGPFNSAVVCDRGQVQGVYRKVHLWDEESRWFTAGDRSPLVVSTSVGHVAVMVCYDLEFPEWPRLARQLGADVIAAPVNWPLLDRPEGQLPLEVVKAQAAAGAYRIPVVVADRAGRERGVDWIGGTCIVGRDGYLAAGPVLDGDAPCVVVADVEPAGGTELGPHNDALLDRLPHHYQER